MKTLKFQDKATLSKIKGRLIHDSYPTPTEIKALNDLSRSFENLQRDAMKISQNVRSLKSKIKDFNAKQCVGAAEAYCRDIISNCDGAIEEIGNW